MPITACENKTILTLMAAWLFVALFPAQAKSQANDIYPVQAIAGQTAPASAQNAYPDDIGTLPPSGDSGNVYGVPGTAMCDIEITPVPVRTAPSELTQDIEATGSPGWPASQCYNFTSVAFGLWQEPSTSDPIAAWVTSGAFVAGTPTVPRFHTSWGRVNYQPHAVAFYTKATSVPKQPLLVISTPTKSTMYVNYRTRAVYMSIEFTDVSPAITLSGTAQLGKYGGTTVSLNTFKMSLSGSGMQGFAVGKLFGPSGVVPTNIGGTFLVNSSGLQVVGSFVGCSDVTMTC